jgi:hypothetical protein
MSTITVLYNKRHMQNAGQTLLAQKMCGPIYEGVVISLLTALIQDSPVSSMCFAEAHSS